MKGHTLLEVLVVLLLIAVVVGFALPGLQTILLKHKATTQANQLIRALHFSRNLALIEHQSVLLCPVSIFGDCGNDWQKGINIYLSKATKKTLIKVIPEFRDAELSWNRKTTQITFSQNGFLSSQNGSFEYQLQDQIKHIVVSSTGRIRSY